MGAGKLAGLWGSGSIGLARRVTALDPGRLAAIAASRSCIELSGSVNHQCRGTGRLEEAAAEIDALDDNRCMAERRSMRIVTPFGRRLMATGKPHSYV